MITRRVSRRFGALLSVSALLIGSACGGGGDDKSSAPSGNAAGDGGTPTAGGHLSYLFLGAPPVAGLDPSGITATSYSSGAPFYSAVFGMLVYEDFKTAKVVPWMAESLTATSPTDWVLKLRDGVKFSDGSPLDADAVKFNWERTQKATTSPVRPIALKIKAMAAADPRTLNITLAAPNSAFDFSVARSGLTFIGSSRALQANAAGFAKAPVGAGPFVLKSLGPDGSAELEKSPTYWDQPRPYLDRITIRNVPDDQQRYNTFAAGGVHMMDTSPTSNTRKQAEGAGYRLLDIDTPGGGSSLIFNTTKPPFNDKAARLAFMHAVDAEAVNRLRFGGLATPTPSFFSEGTPFHEPKATFPAHDKAKAQQLFDEYAAKNGPLKITMTGVAGPGNVAEVFQAQLAEYKNVTFQINAVATTALVPTLMAGSFDVATFPVSMSHPLSEFQTFYETGGAFNFGKYSNPRVDAMLREAASTTDRDKQVKAFSEAQQALVDDAATFYYGRLLHTSYLTKDVRIPAYAGNGIWLWDRMWLQSASR